MKTCKTTYKSAGSSAVTGSAGCLITLIRAASICLMLIPALLPAQQKRASITGVIVDRQTKSPLFYAEVFLANTTIGTTTDTYGRFTVKNVPAGTHQLVVSMIGYERIVREIRVTEPDEYNFTFSLEPKAIETKGLTVSARYPHQWKKQLETFRTVFLGESDNANKCEIINPEILDFRTDSSGNFYASAQQPLEIENRALGYKLFFHIRRFEIVKNTYLVITGETRFEVSATDDNQMLRTWRKNRETAFRGSMRHFFKALLAHRLKEEGFALYALTGLPTSGNIVGIQRIQPDSLVHDTQNPFEKVLTLPNYLQIIYLNEDEPPSYKRSSGKLWYSRRGSYQSASGRYSKGQTSYLEVKYQSVLVNRSGHLYDPLAVTVYGYWSWEQRIADMLPLDYDPDLNALATH